MSRTFLAGLVLCAVSFPSLAGSVVVGADSSAGAMDAEAVKRVFLGREATVGGKPVVVVYQKAGATKQAFEGKVLGRSGADLAGYWSKLIFTGKAKAPEELASDAAVKAKVASTPGAVGYIDDAAVDGTVKVLFKF
ncbi:type 2 periplasmic-binding domain-containing protein [Pseudoxanthomonas sp. 10H]|uniref:phosphate ABC transporter substrate-binding protein n=1 Tax=Pseudoxanthomonas sp. 10H TaxID=3242729 RepID=UPI0035570A30